MWISILRSIERTKPYHYDGRDRQSGKRCSRTGSTEHEPDVRTSDESRRTGTGSDVPIRTGARSADLNGNRQGEDIDD